MRRLTTRATDAALCSILVLLAYMPATAAFAQGARRLPTRVGAVSLPGTGTLRPSNTDTFTFIVAGDNRPPKADSAQPPTPGLIFAAAKKAKVAFAIWTGDMIYGLDSVARAKIRKQYEVFLAIAKTGGTPVFSAPGNHEMDVKVKVDSTSGAPRKETGSAAMQALYRASLGLAPGAPVYQAFTYGNSRFILLNTEEVSPPATPRSRGATVAGGQLNLDPGYVGSAQLTWLAQQLDSSDGARHVFVFMHHPIKPKKATMALDSASAAKLTALFAKHHNISYVLASHEHLYYNPQTHDESPPPGRDDPSRDAPYYVVSGGAGAPLAEGGFHNYLVVSVKKAHVDVAMVRLP